MSRSSHLFNPTASKLSPSLGQFWQALQERRFFKLICGASFQDAQAVTFLSGVYGQVGLHAIDIGPHPTLLPAIRQARQHWPEQQVAPVLMVSLDLDGDPHFRQVAVVESECIACEACLPSCPTEALTMGTSPHTGHWTLLVEAPRCYGCGRCVPECPTDAFRYEPVEQLAGPLGAMLADPLVEAVELHTTQLDPHALANGWDRLGSGLTGKVVSLCARPQLFEREQVAQYWETLVSLSQASGVAGLMWQVDGQPMSGNEDPQASLPALKAACQLKAWGILPPEIPVTISGGINAQTATWLREPEYDWIAGVGMGTMARRQIWSFQQNPQQAHSLARSLVQSFTVNRS